MSNSLLVDFGASRIKSVLWSSDFNQVIDRKEIPSPKPSFGSNGEVEVSPDTYWSALEEIASYIFRKNNQIDNLWLCTEMHGVLVADSLGHPVTPYISWRDGRGVVRGESTPSTLDLLKKDSNTFYSLTGMNFRSGLPIVTLRDLSRYQMLPNDIRIYTLSDWLLWRGGERDPAVHSSLAAGTGFFDINLMRWSAPLLEIAQLDPKRVKLSRIASSKSYHIGNIQLGGVSIKVYGGVGDLQASILGASFPDQSGLLINLGTGSQVVKSFNGYDNNNRFEKRIGAKGEQFTAVTHIPSGRALNVFSVFMNECSRRGRGNPVFWELFENLSKHSVLNACINVRLNVFPTDVNDFEGGSIRFIRENGFSVDDFVAGLAKSWISQYVDVFNLLDPEKQENDFLLIGGLGQRINFILPVLSELAERKGKIVKVRTGEITLDGLLALSNLFI